MPVAVAAVDDSDVDPAELSAGVDAFEGRRDQLPPAVVVVVVVVVGCWKLCFSSGVLGRTSMKRWPGSAWSTGKRLC